MSSSSRNEVWQGFINRAAVNRWQNSAAILLQMILITLTLVARSAARPVLHVEIDPMSPAIAFLSWDTEGGKQARINLLRSGSVIRVCIAGEWLQSEKIQFEKLQSENQSKRSRYRLSLADDITLTWTAEVNDADLSITLAGEGAGLDRVEAIELVFPFDPRVTATTVLPSKPTGSLVPCLRANKGANFKTAWSTITRTGLTGPIGKERPQATRVI
jgi:hypothetical protein